MLSSLIRIVYAVNVAATQTVAIQTAADSFTSHVVQHRSGGVDAVFVRVCYAVIDAWTYGLCVLVFECLRTVMTTMRV